MKNSKLGMGPIETAAMSRPDAYAGMKPAPMSAKDAAKAAALAASVAAELAWLDAQPATPGLRVRGSDIRAAAEAAKKSE